MVASGEEGYAKEWQDAVLEDAAAHAAEHGLDTRRREAAATKAKESLERRFDKDVQERVNQRMPELTEVLTRRASTTSSRPFGVGGGTLTRC
jgi:hypothetical protein